MKLLGEALIKFTCGLLMVGLLFGPMLAAGFVVAGLDFRFGW